MTPDVLGHVGRSKSGKTWTMQREMARAVLAGERRFAVFGRHVREWPGPLAQARGATIVQATGVGYTREALSHRPHVAIIHPTPKEANREGLHAFAERVLDARGWTVVVNEAALFLGVNEPLSWRRKGEARYALRELVTNYRHYDCAMWWDAQRLAEVNATLRSQTEDWRMFAQASYVDLDTAKKMGGPQLEKALRQISDRFDGGRGERGWHVNFAAGTMGPFELSR